jgi:hypothetical protein
MGEQDRKGQTTTITKIALDAFFLGAFRIGVALVSPMAVDRSGATAATGGPLSFELIFAKLNRRTSPES